MGLDGYVGGSADAARIRRLEDERQASKAAFDAAAKSRGEERSRLVGFAASASERAEAAFKQDTVGLQTQAQFAEKRANVERELEKERKAAERGAEAAAAAASARRRAQAQAAATARLSFAAHDGDGDGGGGGDGDAAPPAAKRPRGDAVAAAAAAAGASPPAAATAAAAAGGGVAKCPEVDTAFLPDRERARAERAARDELAAEWAAREARLKASPLEVRVSYFDGQSHRCTAVVPRGGTVGTLLRACRDAAGGDGFKPLRTNGPDSLLLVKLDVVLPHSITLHELISRRAQGRTGALMFQLESEAASAAPAAEGGGGGVARERIDAHPAKMVTRAWYAANKHIFPASKWEPFSEDTHYPQDDAV